MHWPLRGQVRNIGTADNAPFRLRHPAELREIPLNQATFGIAVAGGPACRTPLFDPCLNRREAIAFSPRRQSRLPSSRYSGTPLDRARSAGRISWQDHRINPGVVSSSSGQIGRRTLL
jgi:hypothetical protein